MQASTFPRRDSAGIFAAQQRFSFGKSPEQLPMRRRYRTGWISDTHLGTRGCNATALLDFLRENDFETLYVVGDLIDIWSLRRGIYWPQNITTSSKKFCARPARALASFIYREITTSW